MNLYQIEKIPFKDKKMLVHEACLMYKKLKQMVRMSGKLKESMPINLREQSLKNFETFSIFETILGLLGPEQSIVIENEFLKNRETRWYEEKWSKSTYYKIKHQTVDQFIYLLFS